MTTRVVATDTFGETKMTTDRKGTTTIRSKSATPLHYLVCDDPKNHSPFVNPRAEKTPSEAPEAGNSSIRPWPSRSTTPSWILQSIVLFDTVFVSWWIMYALNAYHEKIPLWLKRKVCFVAWEWYVWIHTLVACGWMGCYGDRSFYTGQKSDPADDNEELTMSDEFKAFSTLMYPVQFYPVNVPMIRFSLSQLNTVSLKDIPLEDSIERIDYAVVPDNAETNSKHGFVVPETQRDHQGVSGLYVTNPNKIAKSGGPKTIIFWIYGGAYLGGDAEGNLSLANDFLIDCNADSVLIPTYRLAPEATVDDVLWDICWSYRYLLRRLEEEEHHSEGYEIVLVGISSGGALALRLLQFLRDRSLQRPMMPSFLEPLVDDILAISKRSSTTVAGGVLFGPYADYRDPQPSDGSFLRNAKYDWIVTEAVQHYGLPYLNGFIPPLGEDLQTNGSGVCKNTHGRILYSPLSHDMNDLPPLCVVASEHEACYDMAIEIVNKARRGVKPSIAIGANGRGGKAKPTEVTVGLWKHMCHVFSMMQALLPEGKASIEFTKEWIRSKTTNSR